MQRTIHAPDLELLSAKEAAVYLNIPETTFEDLAIAGDIPPGCEITKRTIRWSWEVIWAVKQLMPFLMQKRAPNKQLSSRVGQES